MYFRIHVKGNERKNQHKVFVTVALKCKTQRANKKKKTTTLASAGKVRSELQKRIVLDWTNALSIFYFVCQFYLTKTDCVKQTLIQTLCLFLVPDQERRLQTLVRLVAIFVKRPLLLFLADVNSAVFRRCVLRFRATVVCHMRATMTFSHRFISPQISVFAFLHQSWILVLLKHQPAEKLLTKS